MQLRCLWVATEAGSMGWTQEEKSSPRRCSHVTTVESCWQARWSCKLTSRWSTKAGGTSSAASATRLSLPSRICRSTRAPCTPECCLIDVTFVRRCSQGEVSSHLTRRVNIRVMPAPSLLLRMLILSRWLNLTDFLILSQSFSLKCNFAGGGHHHPCGGGGGWWSGNQCGGGRDHGRRHHRLVWQDLTIA